jgi:hypothetical protein
MELISRQVLDLWNKYKPTIAVDAIEYDRELKKLLSTNLAEVGTDCISRQAAISAICNACGKIDCDKMDKCKKLQLPPANCSEFPNNSDTISREAVADAINRIKCTKYTTWYEFYQKVMTAVEKLPPAEPQIIRCKECKHWIPYDWMFSEVWQSKNIADYPEDEIGCAWCDMAMKANDFCSFAEKREVTT